MMQAQHVPVYVSIYQPAILQASNSKMYLKAKKYLASNGRHIANELASNGMNIMINLTGIDNE